MTPAHDRHDSQQSSAYLEHFLEDLKTSALANSPRLFPPVISSMACIIEEMNRGLNLIFKKPVQSRNPAPFYVLATVPVSTALPVSHEDVLKTADEWKRI